MKWEKHWRALVNLYYHVDHFPKAPSPFFCANHVIVFPVLSDLFFQAPSFHNVCTATGPPPRLPCNVHMGPVPSLRSQLCQHAGSRYTRLVRLDILFRTAAWEKIKCGQAGTSSQLVPSVSGGERPGRSSLQVGCPNHRPNFKENLQKKDQKRFKLNFMNTLLSSTIPEIGPANHMKKENVKAQKSAPDSSPTSPRTLGATVRTLDKS